jgi:uncharacterized membrane protein
MQMVKKFLLVVAIVWFAVLAFMPKLELYYTAEEALAKQDIVLNEEKISESLFGLNLEKVSVFVKGIKIASIEELDVFTLLFYTHIELKDLHIDDSLKQMVPQEIKQITLSHSVVAPTELSLQAQGAFGAMRGQVSLLERKVYLDFNESKASPLFGSPLKKTEKGWVYETSF